MFVSPQARHGLAGMVSGLHIQFHSMFLKSKLSLNSLSLSLYVVIKTSGQLIPQLWDWMMVGFPVPRGLIIDSTHYWS